MGNKLGIKIDISTPKKRNKRKSKRRRNNKKGKNLNSILVIILLLIGFGVIGTVIRLLMYVLIAACILFIAYKIYKKIVRSKEEGKLRSSNIYEIDKMEGSEFEKYLGALFKSLGYKSEVTKTSGDQGADLILEKDGNVIVVQAKRYSNNVGNSAVQEIFASKNFYNANDAWVITNSYFTRAAQELAKANKVKLIDRDQLIELSLKSLQTV